jgi:hypothetical protein
MKNNYLKYGLLVAALSTISLTGFAQHWILGGNNVFPPPDAITTANNFLGSAAPNNTWLRFGVNGNQDIFIDNLNGAFTAPNVHAGVSELLPAQVGTSQPLGGHWVGLGRIFEPSSGTGANTSLAPQAHLHIHGGNNTPYAPFSSSLRNWFQQGVLCSENSDAMYTGMRDLFPATGLTNSSYAVINWSDDNAGGNGTDFLSFNFTGNAGGTPVTNDGMELGRFDPTIGALGVGNFMNIGTAPNKYYTQPVRRLEVLDYDPLSTASANSNTPQLRLTYEYNASPANGRFSEFQSTNLGDLYINTHDWTKPTPYSDRFTGFHTITPKNTVEINSQLTGATANDPNVPASWPGGTGASGLRFTDLTSGSTITPTTTTNGIDNTKVLSVDKNGDVVLVNPIAGTSNNGISVNPTTGAFQLGAPCVGATFNQLLQSVMNTNSQILLNSKAFVFSESTTGTGRVGVGNILACTVNNTFEIAADGASLYPPGGGASGLRFTFLKSSSLRLLHPM